MNMKWTIRVVLLAATFSMPLAAQTLSEQLQKGIYTEETLGDRVEAARIYRQILAAPAVPRSIAQDAERRLARLTAAQRPGVPVNVILPSSGQSTVTFEDQKRGAVENGRYRHFSSGMTFDLPPGWTAGATYASSDGGDMVTLTHEATKRSINVWMIKEETPDAQVAARVAGAPANKLEQRHSGYSIPGMLDDRTYDIPKETVQPTLINGRHAIVAVGKYLGIPLERAGNGGFTRQSPADTAPMNEYMTWIYTPHSRAFFFARVPVDDLWMLRPDFELLVYSAVIP
jgi:hypothetical protein